MNLVLGYSTILVLVAHVADLIEKIPVEVNFGNYILNIINRNMRIINLLNDILKKINSKHI